MVHYYNLKPNFYRSSQTYIITLISFIYCLNKNCLTVGINRTVIVTVTIDPAPMWNLSVTTPNLIFTTSHINSYLLTHLRSLTLLEKLPIVQLLKNFPAFQETQRFITVFTRALHWSLF
jgi:hypothetical protein